MTLETSQASVVYKGDGNNTSFPFSFPIADLTQVFVTITDTTQTPNVVTILNGGTQFGISPMPCPNGGTITYPYPSGTPLGVGQNLTIRRIVPFEQTTSIVNQDGFYPEILEGALDYLTMQTQQLAEQASRALQVPVGSGIDPVAYLNGIETTFAALAAEAAASASQAAQSAESSRNYIQTLAGTSATTMIIASGPQTFTTQAGLNMVCGQFVAISAASVPSNYMHGQITAYDPATGDISVAVEDTGGSGMFSSWTVSVSAPQGPVGPSGSVISITAGPGLSGGTITETGTLSVGGGAITNAMLSPVPALTVKGNSSTAAAAAQDLPFAMLGGYLTPSLSLFSPAGQGAVPASGGGPLNFLRADGKWATTPNVPVRQTVLAGDVDANRRANFLTAGIGLTPAYTAASGQLLLTFANGFGSCGASDLMTQITAGGPMAPVAANAVSYLYALYASPTAVTWGSTLIPPQYGQTFDAQGYALYHLENNGTDDYGNPAATNSAGSYSTAQARFGGYSWSYSATSSLLTTGTTIKSSQPWTLEFWMYVPVAGQTGNFLFSSANTYSLQIGLYNGALMLNASSANGAWDVVSAAYDATALSIGWHHVALTWDGGTYRGFRDGFLSFAAASTSPVWLGSGTLSFGSYNGARIGNGAPLVAAGYFFDEIRISPCCRYPTSGVTVGASVFTPPAAAFTADGDFFDTGAMQMNAVTGAGPSFTPIEKLYVGECVTGTSTISSITSYALQGRYVGPWTASNATPGTAYSYAHNLGTSAHLIRIEAKNVIAELGYSVGDITVPMSAGSSGGAWSNLIQPAKRRNTDIVVNGNTNAFVLLSLTTGSASSTTTANWNQRVIVERSF